MSKWFVYILCLNNGHYYTGITNDLEARLLKHARGTGSKYVRCHLPFKLIWTKSAKNRSEASKIEYKIKQLNKKQKQKIIKEKDNDFKY